MKDGQALKKSEEILKTSNLCQKTINLSAQFKEFDDAHQRKIPR